MTNTRYFKQSDTNTLFSVSEEDETINDMYLDIMETEGVHLDSDSNWHYHKYDFSLLDNYTVKEVVSLMKQDKDFGPEIEYINDYMDIDDNSDINILKEALSDMLGYVGVSSLYKLVNDDENSDIVAYVVGGYSQGDYTFVWFHNYLASGMKDTYTPEYVQSVLYDTWLAIDHVDSEGEYLQGLDNIVTRDDEDVTDYMLENYNAIPASTKIIIY